MGKLSFITLNRNKWILVFVIVFLVFLLFPVSSALAHPGNTDSSGGHTCRTNCSSWGLYSGQYHFHQSKGVPQYEDPIRSHYGPGGTGYTEPWDDYRYQGSYSYPSTPSCPTFSTYSSISGGCKCNYGYVASDNGTSCVSATSYCYQEYGYSSRYNSLTKSCECNYGSRLDSSGQCVDEDQYCQDIYGYNSEYDILDDDCSCKRGYVPNSSGNSCISGDTYCQSEYGYNSSFGYFSEVCECDFGYELRNGQCRAEVVEEEIDYSFLFEDRTTFDDSFLEEEEEEEIPVFIPPPVSTQVASPPVNTQKQIETPSVKEASKPVELDDEEFRLVGNELLRKCASKECDVAKWGSTNGKAKILEKNDSWFKVLTTDKGIKTQGWFHESIISEDAKSDYSDRLVEKQEVEDKKESKGFWKRLWSSIFGK